MTDIQMTDIQTTFRLHSDPGHGWLAVPRGLVDALGIASLISVCSYEKNGTVYLEEDLDATIFMVAFERVYPGRFTLKRVYRDGNSLIRAMPRYANPCWAPDSARSFITAMRA